MTTHGRAASAAGDTNVKVASVTNLAAGNPVFIDNGANIEYDQIQARSARPARPGTGVTLAHPLTAAHATGVPFNVNQGQPIGYTGDTIEHLNYFAAGAPHGCRGPAQPTEELKRALELPGRVDEPAARRRRLRRLDRHAHAPVAYFETSPVNPTSTTTVGFDAGFARAADGSTAGLTYYWDFGDGTHATGEDRVAHVRRAGLRRREARGRQGRAMGPVPPGRSRSTLPPAPRRAPPRAARSRPDEAAALIAAASGGGTPASNEEVNR